MSSVCKTTFEIIGVLVACLIGITILYDAFSTSGPKENLRFFSIEYENVLGAIKNTYNTIERFADTSANFIAKTIVTPVLRSVYDLCCRPSSPERSQPIGITHKSTGLDDTNSVQDTRVVKIDHFKPVDEIKIVRLPQKQ